MASRRYTIDMLEKAIKDSNSWRETQTKLGLNPDGGGNSKTLKKLADKNGFDYSHFLGQGWSKGQQSRNFIPLAKQLKNGVYVKSNSLKRKLLNAGMLKNECSECGLKDKWQGKDITLELDHIDGDNYNNELKNLRILCPNCHSQTPNFRGRNQKKHKMLP